jgi:hypothetical protein
MIWFTSLLSFIGRILSWRQRIQEQKYLWIHDALCRASSMKASTVFVFLFDAERKVVYAYVLDHGELRRARLHMPNGVGFGSWEEFVALFRVVAESFKEEPTEETNLVLRWGFRRDTVGIGAFFHTLDWLSPEKWAAFGGLDSSPCDHSHDDECCCGCPCD